MWQCTKALPPSSRYFATSKNANNGARTIQTARDRKSTKGIAEALKHNKKPEILNKRSPKAMVQLTNPKGNKAGV
jgi:hypothetical protein